MRRILASEFVTLDGVIEAPGHEEHRDGRNAWALNLTSEDMLAHAAEQILGRCAPVGTGDVSTVGRILAARDRRSP
jgi:hypothetical protein